MRIARARVFAGVVLLAFACAASAQSTARPRPPGTLPLEEVPPPPPAPIAQAGEPTLERSQVTMRTEGDLTIQEYRVNGKVFMQRVTPKHGKPYLLIDHHGDGTFTRQDNTLDSGLRLPQWVILEF